MNVISNDFLNIFIYVIIIMNQEKKISENEIVEAVARGYEFKAKKF